MKKIISLFISVATLFAMLTITINCNAAKIIYGDTEVIDHVVYKKITENDKKSNKSITYYSVSSLFDSDDSKKTVKEINIAREINGIPVIKFESFVYDYNEFPDYENAIVEKISLPNTIKIIDSSAFALLKNLKSINIPESVEYIGSDAFYNCSSLESIVFPSKVLIINRSVCKKCTSLKKVTFKGKVKSVCSYAFANCTNLKKLTLPNSVEYFGNCVLQNTKVTRFTLPKKAITKNYPFASTKNLKNVTIKSFPNTFEYGYFYKCKSLKEVHLESIKKFKDFVVGEEAFKGTKPGIKFYVRNKKLAKKLYNGLKSRKVKKAKIYVGKKLFYKTK